MTDTYITSEVMRDIENRAATAKKTFNSAFLHARNEYYGFAQFPMQKNAIMPIWSAVTSEKDAIQTKFAIVKSMALVSMKEKRAYHSMSTGAALQKCAIDSANEWVELVLTGKMSMGEFRKLYTALLQYLH